jgi:ADP-ribose pyrophosphatase
MNFEQKVVKTEVVFKGRYVQTEVQTILLPDGSQATREIVSPPDAVGVLAIDELSNVYLVRQYRPAIKKVTIEIPAGIIDGGENPLETANRECQEEISMKPGTLKPLCSFYHSVGFSTGKIQIVVAEKLTPVTDAHYDPDEFLEVLTLSFQELFQKVINGEIVDSKTIVATLWYHQNQSMLRSLAG